MAFNIVVQPASVGNANRPVRSNWTDSPMTTGGGPVGTGGPTGVMTTGPLSIIRKFTGHFTRGLFGGGPNRQGGRGMNL